MATGPEKTDSHSTIKALYFGLVSLMWVVDKPRPTRSPQKGRRKGPTVGQAFARGTVLSRSQGRCLEGLLVLSRRFFPARRPYMSGAELAESASAGSSATRSGLLSAEEPNLVIASSTLHTDRRTLSRVHCSRLSRCRQVKAVKAAKKRV